jgi:putative transposase
VTEVYEFIDAEYATSDTAPTITITITRMCAWLEVSRSGFYDWKSRPESATAKRQESSGC